MGKAKVVSGGPDGKYTIEMDYGAAVRDARVAELTTRITELSAQVTAAQAKYDAQEAIVGDLRDAANLAIEAYAQAVQLEPHGKHEALARKAQEAVTAVVKGEGVAGALRGPLEDLKALKKAAELAKTGLQATTLEEVRANVWCVDLTESAAVGAEVATIEVPGENQSVLIAPGCVAPVAGDGVLAARELMSPEQVFWNAAVLPGWQKWKPTYRKAQITAISDDETVTLAMDSATSSAQRLDVNQTQTLENVPVQYMECDAAAFDVGDRVVVMFEGMNWASPKVIGFVEEPIACNPWKAVGVQWMVNAGYTGMGWLVLVPTTEVVLSAFDPTTGTMEARAPGGAWTPLGFTGLNNNIYGWGFYEPQIDWYEAKYHTTTGNQWGGYVSGVGAPFLRLPLFRENFGASPIPQPMPFGAVQYRFKSATGTLLLNVAMRCDAATVGSAAGPLDVTCKVEPIAGFYNPALLAGPVGLRQTGFVNLGFPRGGK